MASSNPPYKGNQIIFDVPAIDSFSPGDLKLYPTINPGDFKVSKDDGAFVNLATIPEVVPWGSGWIKITISAEESNCDRLKIQGIDQASPKQYSDIYVEILTVIAP
jgi:hypothetical protein